MTVNPIETIKQHAHLLSARDRAFAENLVYKAEKGWLKSDKQYYWLNLLADRALELSQGIPDFSAPEGVSVGDFKGVMALFDTAKAHLKHPKIVLQTSNHMPVCLQVTGPKSRRPGTVAVSDGGPFRDNKFYGRITPEGVWEPASDAEGPIKVPLLELLLKLAQAPAQTAAEYGKLTGNCCFCNCPLTDPKSTAVGYGPICAKHYGLPHGVH